MKLEIFDPPMCCSTGICGNSVDPRLVTFASDLEWLKKQGVDVVRYGLSFEPGEFIKNETVKITLQTDGNNCLPLVFADGVLSSKACYPSREKLAEICKIGFNEDEAPPIHREENCCCGVDCDCGSKEIPRELTKDECGTYECNCSNAAAEDNCTCGPECDCHKSPVSDIAKKIIFIVIVLIMAIIVAAKFCCPAKAIEHKKKAQTISAEAFANNINSLNEISVNQEVAFVYIPTVKNEKIDDKTKAVLSSTQKTLKKKNINSYFYTISTGSLEYRQLASKTSPPAILTIYKGKGQSFVSGTVNKTRLLQSYIAASRDGGCGAGCPCHKK